MIGLALRQRRNRGVWIAVAILVLIGTAVWSHYKTPPSPTPAEGKANGEVKVVRVIDGDTIVVTGGGLADEHLRLLGVDTPETRPQPMYFGPEAKAYTAKLLPAGQPVILKFDTVQKRDRYQRLLAYVYLNDTDCVNVMLVRDGMAYVDRRFKTMLQATLEQTETQARGRGVGLWMNVKTADQPAWRQKWLKKQPDWTNVE